MVKLTSACVGKKAMGEKKSRLARSGLRGIARFCALQKLYGLEFRSSLMDVMKRYAEIDDKRGTEECDVALLSDSVSVSEMDKMFLKRLLEEYQSNSEKIDQAIRGNLSRTWSMERLDPVTKCILRLGITELEFFPEIPENVIFNEYIEIAKAFFETQEVAFINGLLNKVAKELRVTVESAVSV